MYFISTAYDGYCYNTRSKFENLLKDPINGSKHVMTVEAVHLQKKFDVFDESIMFVSFMDNIDQNETSKIKKDAQGEFSLFKYSISFRNNVVVAGIN